MKKRIVLILMVSFVLIVSVFAGGARDSGTMTLKLGHIRDTNHPTHKGAELFAQLVE